MPLLWGTRPPQHAITVAWAAMRAASMLRPGGPGAQKETRRWLPPRARPSARCWAWAVSDAASRTHRHQPSAGARIAPHQAWRELAGGPGDWTEEKRDGGFRLSVAWALWREESGDFAWHGQRCPALTRPGLNTREPGIPAEATWALVSLRRGHRTAPGPPLPQAGRQRLCLHLLETGRVQGGALWWPRAGHRGAGLLPRPYWYPCAVARRSTMTAG